MFEPSGSPAFFAPAAPPLGRRGAGPIALIGNFLPPLCGIAAFTRQVHEAVRTVANSTPVEVYAMVEPGRRYDFAPAVSTWERMARRAVGWFERIAPALLAQGVALPTEHPARPPIMRYSAPPPVRCEAAAASP